MLNVCNGCCDNDRKVNFPFFFPKFKRHNSLKNHQSGTEFELGNYIVKTHLYIELNVCNSR